MDLTLLSIRSPLGKLSQVAPPRDGIPAILNPVLIPAKDATFLRDEDRVLGIAQGKDVRAYPVKILNWHEVVNDTVAGKPVVITYCPLCGTGIGFDGLIEGRTYTFGVSGLLYQSDLLMYDHQTESLWSQIAMEAVTGSMAGQKLRHLFLEHTTWGGVEANSSGDSSLVHQDRLFPGLQSGPLPWLWPTGGSHVSYSKHGFSVSSQGLGCRA